MSRGLARLGDRTIGTCVHPSHFPVPGPLNIGGTIVVGTPGVTSGNLPDARMTDLVVTDCGHTDMIITGSVGVTSSILGTARLGDSTGGFGIYFGTIIAGDSNATTP